jgi:hypothetical protein
VKIPPLPHLILLFFLGGVFLHFLLAGARTFARSGISDERGAGYAQISFVFGGTMATWFLGLYQPIHLANAIIATVVLLASISLYEWSRHTIWLRRFHVGWSGFVWGRIGSCGIPSMRAICSRFSPRRSRCHTP